MSPKSAGFEPAFAFLDPGQPIQATRLPPGKESRGSTPAGNTAVTPDKPKKWVPPKGGVLHKARLDAAAELRANVLERAQEVFDRFVDGESFQAIAITMPFDVAGWKLRSILMENDQTKEMFSNVLAFRAHALVEQAIDHGRMAAAIGDSAGLRAAIDVNLKVAAKLAPREYGDTSKLELTGKNGGALEIKADLTLTAEQAYERLIKGQ